MELKRIVVVNGHVGRKYISLVVPGVSSLIPCELRMWEKKFGKNANHVKQQQRSATERRLPGFVPADRRSGKGKSSSRPIQFRDHEQVRKEPEAPRGPEGTKPPGSAKEQSARDRGKVDLRINRTQGDRPLHPSWEAKRKQKSAGIVHSQGTKIVFSEP